MSWWCVIETSWISAMCVLLFFYHNNAASPTPPPYGKGPSPVGRSPLGWTTQIQDGRRSVWSRAEATRLSGEIPSISIQLEMQIFQEHKKPPPTSQRSQRRTEMNQDAWNETKLGAFKGSLQISPWCHYESSMQPTVAACEKRSWIGKHKSNIAYMTLLNNREQTGQTKKHKIQSKSHFNAKMC